MDFVYLLLLNSVRANNLLFEFMYLIHWLLTVKWVYQHKYQSYHKT